jgi:hypothetical protein
VSHDVGSVVLGGVVLYDQIKVDRPSAASLHIISMLRAVACNCDLLLKRRK